jgi:selenocysteine lyase/cysteine desulfurase
MDPFLGGGDMISSVTFERSTWNELPHKFEAGTPDIAGVVGLSAAIDYLASAGLDEIAAHERDLLEYGTSALEAIDGVRLIGTARSKASILSFVMDDVYRDPHRAPLRAAGHGPLRRARNGARLDCDVQHARRHRRAGRCSRPCAVADAVSGPGIGGTTSRTKPWQS